jgi:hypothetical protein
VSCTINKKKQQLHIDYPGEDFRSDNISITLIKEIKKKLAKEI